MAIPPHHSLQVTLCPVGKWLLPWSIKWDTFQSHRPSSMHKLPADVTIPGLKTIAFTVSQFVWIRNPGPAWLVPLAQGLSRWQSSFWGCSLHLKAPSGGPASKLHTPGGGICFSLFAGHSASQAPCLLLGWRIHSVLTLQSFSQDAKGGATVFL